MNIGVSFFERSKEMGLLSGASKVPMDSGAYDQSKCGRFGIVFKLTLIRCVRHHQIYKYMLNEISEHYQFRVKKDNIGKNNHGDG